MAPACLHRIRIHELPTASRDDGGAENPCGLDALAAVRHDFARLPTENGTTILKFMLHISKKEQGERLQDRLDEPKSRARR